jgi:hypothetical protein
VKRVLIAFAGAFALSAAVVGVQTGCLPISNDCDCPSTPPLPERQEPIPGLTVTSFDAGGNSVKPPVSPENGTAEVTGSDLVFVYTQAGVQHRVVYSIVRALP